MTDTHTAPPRPCRWLAIGLLASLSVNLLIAGLIAGAALTQGRAPPDDPRVAERVLIPLGLGLYARALDPEDRHALIQDATGQRDALRPARAEMRRNMADLARAVRAEPYDADAVRAVLSRQRAAVAVPLRVGEDVLVARLAGMSPEARAAFADRIDAAMRRDRRDRRPPGP
jgi:uncharacterized membrane protein